MVGCGNSNSNLPVKTIEFKPDQDGFLQFYTNDEKYHGKFSSMYYLDFFNTPMTTVEAEIKKVSGNPEELYGLIFCVQEIEQGQSPEQLYCLLIDTCKNFYIFKDDLPLDGNTSEYLNSGFNVINKIKITRADNGKFTIYFNDQEAYSFTDNSYNKGTFGFGTNIGKKNEESFPNTPVDIRCKITAYPDIEDSNSLKLNMQQPTLKFKTSFSQNLAK